MWDLHEKTLWETRTSQNSWCSLSFWHLNCYHCVDVNAHWLLIYSSLFVPQIPHADAPNQQWKSKTEAVINYYRIWWSCVRSPGSADLRWAIFTVFSAQEDKSMRELCLVTEGSIFHACCTCFGHSSGMDWLDKIFHILNTSQKQAFQCFHIFSLLWDAWCSCYVEREWSSRDPDSYSELCSLSWWKTQNQPRQKVLLPELGCIMLM